MFSPVYSKTLRDGGLEVSIRDTPRPLIRLTIFDAISVIVGSIFSAGQLPELDDILMTIPGIRAGSGVCHRTLMERGGYQVTPSLHM